MKIVNVTGVGNAGKGAVVDLLREFNSIWAPRSDFEFDFFRVYGGMFDFLNTWCPRDLLLASSQVQMLRFWVGPHYSLDFVTRNGEQGAPPWP